LEKSKLDVRNFFKEFIFRPTFEDQNIDCNEDAIFLSSFVELLKTINIDMDTIDSYCIYMRLKIVENFEAISLNNLEQELNNFGKGNEIAETNSSNDNFKKNETNSKSVDVKQEDIKNETKNFITNQKNSSENHNLSLKNEDLSNLDNKKFKEQLVLIETESEKESIDDLDDSDSKLDSISSGDRKNNSKNIQ